MLSYSGRQQLSGAILLALAVTAADRWSELQQNWDRALPFGVLALIFLGAGASEATRQWVLPGLGVVAAILITLPFGEHAHGAWGMFIAALGLLAFGGILLPVWLAEAGKDKAHKIQAWRFPTTLILTGMIVGQAPLVFLKGSGLAPAGWWGLGVLVSGVLATAWEVIRGVNLEISKAGQPADGPDHPRGAGRVRAEGGRTSRSSRADGRPGGGTASSRRT